MDIQLINNFGKSLGVISFESAKLIALSKGLDLLKVGLNKNIPIYKLFSRNKYFFLKKKSSKKNKNKSLIKEYYISFGIEDNDLNHIFLKIALSINKGNIVNLYINNSKQFLRLNNRNYFIEKIKLLINNKLLIKTVIKNSNKGFFFVLKK